MTDPTERRQSIATFLRGQPRSDAGTPVTATDPAAADEDVSAPSEHVTAGVAENTDLLDAATDAAPAPEATTGPALDDAAAAHGQDAEAPSVDDAATATAPDEPVVPAAAAIPQTAPAFMRGTTSPAFARAPSAPAPIPRWQWGLAAGLGVLLLVQIVVADRATLAADASTRPLASAVCTVLRCSLPAWHEPTAFTMLSREIRPVPGQAGALQVQVSFRNDARWAQQWPALQLALSDADGRSIGAGAFKPQDYLGSGDNPDALIAPGQSAQITFRVREPAATTVAFTFDFL